MTIPSTLSASSKKPAAPSTCSPPSVSKTVDAKRGRAVPAQQGQGSSGCCGCLTGLILMGFMIPAFHIYISHRLDYNDYSGYHDGDQIVVSRVADSFSSVLCQTFKVAVWADSDQGASFYLTDGPAALSPEARELVVVRNSGLQSEQEFDYRAFYLLPGSTIEASACMSIFDQFPYVQAEVIIIRGSDRFAQWTHDARCADCVTKRATIFPDLLCETADDVLTSYVVDDADTYYVVITRQYRSEDDVAVRADVTIAITKTMYDVSRVKQKCLHDISCKFNLTYNSDDDIILEFPFQEFSPEDPENSFTAECEIRTKFFLIVFVLVPASLIMLVTLVSCIICLRPDAAWTTSSKAQLQKKKAEVKAVLVNMPEQDRQHGTPPV